jgi:hypothetical protein
MPAIAQELPAGTSLEVRLSSPTGSRISHRGDPIEGTIIAPVSVYGQILIPQGSGLLGSIANASAIGFGLKHSTASIAYAFDTLRLPGGAAVPVKTQLVEVETAKEEVDDRGAVHGIHPIVSVSSILAFYTMPLVFISPAVGIPVLGVKLVLAPSANPEIYFPAGTELILRLTTAATIPTLNTDSVVPAKSFSRSELANIEQILKNSAPRASMGDRPSDIINMLLIGSRSQLDQAFHASGWSKAQRKSPMSLYRMYHALTKRNGYPKAPMNALRLSGAPSAFVYQKGLDTVQKRHHVRFWQYSQRTNIWLGAAAEDVGFRFKWTHWTHSTDPNIDSERAKVVNDLAYTGCVSAAGLLPRASTQLIQDPKAKRPILTDGSVAVIRLDDCFHPNVMAGVEKTPALRQGGRVAGMLAALRVDLVRSNILFTTYNTLKLLPKYKAEPTMRRPALIEEEPRGLDWLTSLAPLPSRPQTVRVTEAAPFVKR